MIAPFGNVGSCANTLVGTAAAAALIPNQFESLPAGQTLRKKL